MLFNIKSVFFLGLMATTYASPISLNNTDVNLENQSLEVRAAVEPMNCGGKVFTEDQIRASISQAKSMIGKPGRYPAHFANKKGKGNEKHISTGGPEGLEYPIKENGGLWTSGMYYLSACCLSFSSRVCILTFWVSKVPQVNIALSVTRTSRSSWEWQCTSGVPTVAEFKHVRLFQT